MPCSVTIVVVPRNARLVNRQLFEVRTVVAVELCIEIRKDATLEERILREVNSSDYMTNLKLEICLSLSTSGAVENIP